MTPPHLTAHFIVHHDYTHIAAALRSFFDTTTISSHVVVTINTGFDPLVDVLKAEFPQVQFDIHTQPQSFAINHNMILKRADTEFVALLNDDIIFHEGAIDTLVNYLQVNKDVGLVGPSLRNPDGTPQVAAYSDPSLFRTLYRLSGLASLTHQQSIVRRWLKQLGLLRLFKVESFKQNAGTRAVPVIKGVAMVVRRSACDQAGYMDEVTKAYGEEYGWHLRLRQSGWRIVLVEEAVVTHYGLGQARLEMQGWVLVEDRKAILSYYVQYRPRWQAQVVRGAILISHGVLRLLWLPRNRQRSENHRGVVQMALSFR